MFGKYPFSLPPLAGCGEHADKMQKCGASFLSDSKLSLIELER
jgi:hypothetical protein